MTAEDRDEAGIVWRQAERSVPQPPLACTWAWTEVWLRHYGDRADHRFVVGERGGHPVAAALLVIGAPGAGGRLGVRQLHIGTAGEPRGESVCVEHNGLLAGEADRPAFARALLELARTQRGWDELLLDGFDAEHAADLGAAEPRLAMRSAACAFTDLGAVGPDGVEVADLLAPHARRPRAPDAQGLRHARAGMGVLAGSRRRDSRRAHRAAPAPVAARGATRCLRQPALRRLSPRARQPARGRRPRRAVPRAPATARPSAACTASSIVAACSSIKAGCGALTTTGCAPAWRRTCC